MTYQVRVHLDGAKPPIWRRLLLSSDLMLDELHAVLQQAMGWTDSHLHQFLAGENKMDRFAVHYHTQFMLDEGAEGVLENQVRLDELLTGPKDRLFYWYDFGDDWEHTLVVEKVLPRFGDEPPAICIGGARACPPEDCGGIDTARAAGQAAKDACRANGGLGEYYSERDTRTPVWLCAGDTCKAADLAGLCEVQRAGGEADPEVVARWLDDGAAPNGECGRAFGARGVHGFDLTFCAPKSVSLIRAVRGDDVADKAIAGAHATALSEAMQYLAQHAGYTRVHNPATGDKDLVRLPGLVAIAYQQETSRAGDPHLHTHVIVPNRQGRRRETGGDRRHVAVSRSQGGRGDLSGHAAPRTAPLARPGVGASRSGYGDGRARRRRPGEHHRVVAALHPAAGVGGQ